MQRLQIELVICLDRHKSDVLALDRLGDSFGINEVVLVRLHEWLHELGSDQLYIVALFSQSTAKEMRPGTRLHPNQAGLQVRGEGNQLLLGELLLQQHLAVIAKSHQVKCRLAKVDAYGTNLHVDDPPSSCL